MANTENLILTLDSFRDYFESIKNADTFICGCGCNQELDLTHGLGAYKKIWRNDSNDIEAAEL